MKPSLLQKAALLLFAVASISACGGDDVGNPTLRGDYALQSVNGAPLPYVTTVNNVKTEILDDVLSLYAGSTYSQISHVRVTTNGQVTTQTLNETGTYGGQGTSVIFVRNSGKPNRVSIFDNFTLTFHDDELTRVYMKAH
ncbi:MAG: hypothetical protein ABI852_04435 [Gemmatimonadaceae bacterium]